MVYHSIAELAQTVSRLIGFDGHVAFDSTKPDGMPRELLDISKLRALECKPKIDLQTALEATWTWYGVNRSPLESARYLPVRPR